MTVSEAERPLGGTPIRNQCIGLVERRRFARGTFPIVAALCLARPNVSADFAPEVGLKKPLTTIYIFKVALFTFYITQKGALPFLR